MILPRVWRATSLTTHPKLRSGEYFEERLLVDGATPGSGETWNLAQVKPGALGSNWILAGGLTPDNVSSAISAAAPWGLTFPAAWNAPPE
nr:hypothetical protein [Leucobacter coleopterorum]